MFRRFRAFSIAALVLIGFLASACGDSATPVADANAKTSGIPGMKVGIDSKLAKSFPSTTSVYIDFGTKSDSSNVKNWQRMLTYLKGVPQVGDTFKSLDGQLNGVVTYDADIQPWLGDEVAFGITDIKSLGDSVSGLLGPLLGGSMSGNTGNATAGDLSILLQASVKDKTKAQNFVKKLLNLASNVNGGQPLPTQSVNYKNVELTQLNLGQGLPTLVYGVTDDRLMFGTEKTVRGAIDQNGNGLDTNANFKKVASKLPNEFLGFFYFDYEQIIKTVLNSPMVQQSLSGVNPACLASLQTLGGVGATASAVDEGFRFDSYLGYTANLTAEQKKTIEAAKNTPNKIAERLPDGSLAVLNSFDLSTFYNQTITGLTSSSSNCQPSGGTSIDYNKTIKDAEDQIGLSFKDDITSWITDEYAVFLAPTKTTGNGQTPVGGAFVAKVSDKTVAQQKLDKIINAIQTKANPPVTFSPKTINGASFKSATSGEGASAVTINIGLVGDYAVVGVTDDVTASAVDAINGKATLNTSDNYKKATGGVYSPFRALFFFDIQKIIQAVQASLPTDQRAEIQNITSKLTAIKAAAASVAVDGTDGSYTSFYLYFPTK